MFKFPRWDELPEMDLYMDQVITYLYEHLKQTYYNEEKFITNAMINNYVKTEMVPRPLKKHYTRYHIAYFMIVTITKRAYSLNQISELIYMQTSMQHSDVVRAYNLFMDRFEKSLNACFEKRPLPVFPHDNFQQNVMNEVIQCLVTKIHTEYILSQKES